jgi:hypothetical protein
VFTRSFSLLTVTGTLIFAAFEEPRTTAPSGRLVVSLTARNGSATPPLAGSLTISGIDSGIASTPVQRLTTQDAQAGTFEVALPPGLYGVQWESAPVLTATSAEGLPWAAVEAAAAASADGQGLAALNQPHWVVVAADQVSALTLRVVPKELPESPDPACLAVIQ